MPLLRQDGWMTFDDLVYWFGPGMEPFVHEYIQNKTKKGEYFEDELSGLLMYKVTILHDTDA